MKANFLSMAVFFFITCFSTMDAACQLNNATNGTIKISFINTLNNVPIILDAANYTNCWNENFTISALKYYISDVQFKTSNKNPAKEKNSYHLIDEENIVSKSFLCTVLPDNYTTLSFLIGVDSLKNVTGAQTDALDPLNGMFWTWNSGYIMFKLEGNSSKSTIVNNKIEYHIGGFAGTNNVLRKVELNLENNTALINKNGLTEIVVQADVGKLWNAVHELKISHTPVCTTPGALAAGIADNYSKAFTVVKIIN